MWDTTDPYSNVRSTQSNFRLRNEFRYCRKQNDCIVKEPHCPKWWRWFLRKMRQHFRWTFTAWFTTILRAKTTNNRKKVTCYTVMMSRSSMCLMWYEYMWLYSRTNLWLFVIYVHNIMKALVISHKLSRLLELLQQTHNNKYLHEYCHKIHQIYSQQCDIECIK